MTKGRAAFLAALAVAAGFAALTVAYLRPPALGHHILPDRGDPVFNLYVLKWVVHQLQLGLPNLWDANFFYPTRGALALSDHLLAPAAELLLFERTTGGGAVAGYALLVLSSFVLCGLTTFLVLWRNGVSAPAAFLGGLAFAFSPFRWSELNHLQLLLMQWIPLVLWLWDRLLAKRTVRWATAFLAVYLLHLFGGAYLAYMVHVPMLVILVSRATAEGRALFAPRALRVLAPVALIAAAAGLGLFVPYARERTALGIERSGREIATLGATFWSFLTPASRNVYGPAVRQTLAAALPEDLDPSGRRENSLFPGFVVSGLALVGLGAFWRRYRAPLRRRLTLPRHILLWGLLLLALVAYVHADLVTLRASPTEPPPLSAWDADAALLAGGLIAWAVLRRRCAGAGVLSWSAIDPWQRSVAIFGGLCVLLCHPLAFAPLMRLLPGLAGLRVPTRFYAFASLAVAYCAACGFDVLRQRFAKLRGRHAFTVAVLALAALEPIPRAVRWQVLPEEPEFAPVYHWLAAQPQISALLELPIRGGAAEAMPMYFSTLHWKPIVNGFSSFLPPTYRELAERAQPLPEDDALALLRGWGVTHLLVHADDPGRFFQAALPAWEHAHVGRDLDEVFRDDEAGDRVYRLRPG